MRLDFNFLVIATRKEAEGWWTDGGSLVVPWKQHSVCLAKDNIQLMFCRRDQRKVMQCWPYNSFLLIRFPCYKLSNADNLKLASSAIWLALDFLSLLLLWLLLCLLLLRYRPCCSRFLIPLPAEPIDHRQNIAKGIIHFSPPWYRQDLCLQLSASHITLCPAEMKWLVAVSGWSLSNWG